MATQYSPLCDTDVRAYIAYCFSNGSHAINFGGNDGSPNRLEHRGCGCHNGASIVDFFCSCFGEGQKKYNALCVDSASDSYVSSSDSNLCQENKLATGITDSNCINFGGHANRGDVDVVGSDEIADTNSVKIETVRLAEGFKGNRGINYERNRKNREQQKNRKAARRALGIGAKDWRGSGVIFKSNLPAVDSGFKEPAMDCGISGFWNSCSADVRQELIDSKARMHIAENNKKTQESERRLKQLQSPEQILKDAMRMVDFASDQAKKQNDSKVCGWAMTVAESYAQSIARSAPTSVESFDEFVKSSSSVTSVSLEVFEELKAECGRIRAECQELKNQVQDLLSAEKVTKEKNLALEKKQEVIAKRIGNSMMQDICAKIPSGVSGSSGRPVLNQEFFLKVQAEKRRKEASGFYEMK